MPFFLLGSLFKTDIGQSVNMGLCNKSLNREKRREEILALMSYYISTNNVYYVNDMMEEKEEKEEEKKKIKIKKMKARMQGHI